MSNTTKEKPSGATPSRRGNPKSRAWNASSTRCGRSWPSSILLRAYDRLLHRVARAAIALATAAQSRRKRLPVDPPPLSPDERDRLLALGFEPVCHARRAA